MKFSFWQYGTIEGFYTVQIARRHIISRRVEVQYSTAEETWDKKPHFAQVKDKYKKKFVKNSK